MVADAYKAAKADGRPVREAIMKVCHVEASQAQRLIGVREKPTRSHLAWEGRPIHQRLVADSPDANQMHAGQ